MRTTRSRPHQLNVRLLGWSAPADPAQAELEKQTGVCIRTIRNFEGEVRQPHEHTMAAICKAFESHGVEFRPDRGGEGVQFQKAHLMVDHRKEGRRRSERFEDHRAVMSEREPLSSPSEPFRRYVEFRVVAEEPIVAVMLRRDAASALNIAVTSLLGATGTISNSTRSDQIAAHCCRQVTSSASISWKQRLRSAVIQLPT
jgi:transcriptional regulator with XRE-family HTH domain